MHPMCFYNNNETKIKIYFELVSRLSVTKKNKDVLMKDHERYPASSTSFPIVNATIHDNN